MGLVFAPGAPGRRALADGAAWDFFFRYPLNRRLLNKSRGAVVHNRWMAERLREVEKRPLAVIPHLVLPAEEGAAAPARPRLGLGDEPLLLCLGHLTRAKRLEAVIEAYRRLLQRGRKATLALVGESKPDYDLRRLLQRFGLAERVLLPGYVADEQLRDWICAADIVLNLRHPSAGETSGTLLKAMSLARPVLVSRSAQYDEIPDGCAVKIDLGAAEVPLLVRQLELLLDDPPLARAIGRFGRAWVQREGEPQAVAARYAASIAALAGAAPRVTWLSLTHQAVAAEPLAAQLFRGGLREITAQLSPPQPRGKWGARFLHWQQRLSGLRFLAYRRWRRFFPLSEGRR